MEKTLILFIFLISLAILLYPEKSNSNTSGSIGGKTGSPNDMASCTQCHYAASGNEAIITTNIPDEGYTAGETYTITATINQPGINKFGFEITAEETNFGSNKVGTFIITNNNDTKLTNNNTAITHKSTGTLGNGSRVWSMQWQAPSATTGEVTFYGGFIASNGDGTNSGDTYHETSLNINENTINHTSNIFQENNIIFDKINKKITLLNNTNIFIYSIQGKLVLSSNKKNINLDHLSKGSYIIKSKDTTQKITIN